MNRMYGKIKTNKRKNFRCHPSMTAFVFFRGNEFDYCSQLEKTNIKNKRMNREGKNMSSEAKSLSKGIQEPSFIEKI